MVDEKAYVYMRDGSKLEGFRFGARKDAIGELVFVTAMTGYPESLTDPSYRGQILIFTHPLIGNYGVPKRKFKQSKQSTDLEESFQSDRIQVEGVVVSEYTNGMKWDSGSTFNQWLIESSIPGIYGIDTRALTIRLRSGGTIIGAISRNGNALQKLEKYDYESINFVKEVSPKEPIFYNANGKSKGIIVVVDFGAKNGLILDLLSLGYDVARIPWDSSPSEVLSYKPSGIVYSSGPGNPNLLSDVVENIRELLSTGIPSLGVCLGHQLAVLALGGKIRKMKFGHRAVNKGVLNLIDGKAYITTHNHGYALMREDMPKSAKILFESIDDKVVEGIMDKEHNLMTVQFHPEARPGAWDTKFVFEMFGKMIANGKKA